MDEPKAQGTVEFLINLISPPFSKWVLIILIFVITISVIAVCSAMSINFFQLARRYCLFWAVRREKEPGDLILDWGNKSVKEAEVRKADLSSQEDTSDALKLLEKRHDEEITEIADVVVVLYQSVEEMQMALVEMRGMLEAEKARNRRWWWPS